MDAVVEPTSPPEEPPSAFRSRYGRIDRKKAKKLYDQGCSTPMIAKFMGVNQSTVWRHLQILKPEKQALKRFQTNRADILAKVQAKSLNLQAELLDTLNDGVIQALKPGEKTGLLMALNAQHGTLFDKERLERGQSTSNQSIHSTMLDATVKELYKPALPSSVRKQSRKQAANHTV
jgi:predicted transcriptional regulator